MSQRGKSMQGMEEFQIGDFADAAEAHMSLLDLLGETEAAPLVEAVFGMSLEETEMNSDGEEMVGEYVANVHYAPARALVDAADGDGRSSFVRALWHSLHYSEIQPGIIREKVVRLKNR